MIGRIAGQLLHRGGDHVLIDTGGVGYEVHCSERTLAMMPEVGGAVALYTELLVREDILQLFGFPSLVEREWHRLLTSVQGVGARGALAILGTLGPDALGRALSLGDAAAIRAAPGIGPKIAQRIVLELQSKVPALLALGGQQSSEPGEPRQGGKTGTQVADLVEADRVSASGATADAMSALVNLGYSDAAAATVLAGLPEDEADGDAAALIRSALRRLAPQAG